jgi:hypothetical protein
MRSLALRVQRKAGAAMTKAEHPFCHRESRSISGCIDCFNPRPFGPRRQTVLPIASELRHEEPRLHVLGVSNSLAQAPLLKDGESSRTKQAADKNNFPINSEQFAICTLQLAFIGMNIQLPH